MSTNPIRGEYELTFFDPPRKWRITMNEQAVVEAQLEVRRGRKQAFELWLAGISDWTTEDWRLLLWAGCRRYQKDLTEDELGDEMDGGALMEFRAVVINWMANLYPESSKKKLDEAVSLANRVNRLNAPGTPASGSPSASA